MTVVDVLAKLGLAWYASIGVISLGGRLCVLFVYNRPNKVHRIDAKDVTASGQSESSLLSSQEHLGVSILRPMSGLDPDLYACLESSFKQDYERFEIILSVKSDADPAIDVARSVIAKYPRVDAKLIIGETNVGVNPKINNLVRSYELSKYPIIWILDSNSWTSTSTLSRSMRTFDDPKVNLMHHIPVAHASQASEVGALLDDVYMGTMHAKMYSIINFLAVAPCVMGKSNIIRKSALPDDGLASFGKFIAEDHLLAVSVWKGRGSHVLAADCVRQPLLNVSSAQYCMRRIRWVRVRKYMTTAATLVEPFTEAFIMGAIGSASISHLTSLSFWHLWACHSILWALMDFIAWTRLRNCPHDEYPPFSPTKGSCMTWTTWLSIWLLRELSALPLWCVAMASDKINWRGSCFVINRDMTARRVES